MINLLEYKGVHTTTKDAFMDIDEKKGIITGYFSIFGNKDSDEDIMMPGAFTKTLSENYRRQKHLYQHNSLQILAATSANSDDGKLTLTQDNKGLRFESQIMQTTSYGRDAIQLISKGLIDENSVGFVTIKAQKKNGYREITEVKLFEGSAVTWGANEFAQNDSIKSMSKDAICNKMDNVLTAIRKGTFENESLFDMLGYYFLQLKTQLYNIEATQPVETTVPDIQAYSAVLDTFNKSLKIN